MNDTLNFTEVPLFSDKQLEKQLLKQLKFLKTVYPFLNFSTWNDGAIELRPIKRNKNNKSYIRSYNTWRLEEKDEQGLRKFLKSLNGNAFCLYYSTYAFDYDRECLKSNGKKFEKGKINNQNALFTCILAMDFDDISYEEFLSEKQKLSDLGIETIDIATGHGFQSLILLKNKVYDVTILRKFTNLMLSKGFKVDSSLVDAARVLRMPYSFNCKSLDEKNKYYASLEGGILPTTDINWTEKRYNVTEVFALINSLPSIENENGVSYDYTLEELKTTSLISNEIIDLEVTSKVCDTKIESLESLYNMINLNKLPEPIKKMLAGSKEGLRNKVLMFLIPFFRNTLGLNIQTIKQILYIWGERSYTSFDKDYLSSEIDRIYSYGLKAKHGAYSEELRKAYGYLELSTIVNNNKTIIPNSIFEDFDVISDCAVKIYFSLKFIETIDKVKEFTKDDIRIYAGISERTVERNIKDLINMGYICKRKTNSRIGEKDMYYINPYFSSTTGFTTFENSTIKLMLQELTDGELKLYSYLRKMVGNSENACWASQKYIAKKIGKAGHFSISKMTDILDKKRFINKKVENKNEMSHATYFLNY